MNVYLIGSLRNRRIIEIGNALREMGHEVRLIAPQYVKPFVKRNKTDPADAEAICEAMGRPGMRFVASSVDMPVVGAKGEARASCGNVRDPEYRFGQ